MKLTFKEFNMVYVVGAFNAVFLTLGIVLFPDPQHYFSPHVFGVMFGFYGFLLIFIDKFNLKGINFRSCAYLTVLFRLAFINLRLILYLYGDYYNVIGDVEVYKIWIQAMVNPGDPRSQIQPWFKYRLGIAPLDQLWLYVSYLLFMGKLDDLFWSEFIFSVLYLFLDIGILYFISKIGELKILNEKSKEIKGKKKEFLKIGMLFQATSMFSIYYFTIKAYYDPLAIILGVAGIYYYFKGKNAISGLLLAMSTLAKYYAALWIYIIIIHLIKKKRYRDIADYIIFTIAPTLIIFELIFFIFHFNPINGFFEFFNSVYKMNESFFTRIRLNQTLFILISDSSFYFLIPITVVAIITIITVYSPKPPDLATFMMATAMTISVMPWFDQRYALWFIPFACVDLLNSKKTFKTLFLLLYVSVYLLIFFERFAWDWSAEISLTITFDPKNPSFYYRISAQPIFYAFLGYFMLLEIKRQFNLRVSFKFPMKYENERKK
ncbi:MAG: hypothetical protein ACTSUK_00495 [Promethearchaeota archaeon]